MIIILPEWFSPLSNIMYDFYYEKPKGSNADENENALGEGKFSPRSLDVFCPWSNFGSSWRKNIRNSNGKRDQIQFPKNEGQEIAQYGGMCGVSSSRQIISATLIDIISSPRTFRQIASRREMETKRRRISRYSWGAAAYQLGNTSSRTITEVKQRWARLVLDGTLFKCCLSAAANP